MQTTSTLTINAGLGAIAFWNTKSTPRVRVQAAAEQAGIERFVPREPAPTSVLRDAMLEAARRLCGRIRRQPFIVRQLADSNAFEVRQVIPDVEQNDYRFCFSASIDESWRIDVLRIGSGMPLWSAIDDDIRRTVAERRTYLPASVVTDVMVRGLRWWGATRLKEDGGVWFLPGGCIPKYRAFASAIHGNGDGPRFCCTTFEIASDPDTIGHVLDSLRSEITAGVDEIMADVLGTDGGMQDRSRRLRIDRANAYLTKVRQYEALTGQTLSDLVGAVDRAKQALALNRLLAVAV